MNIQQNISLRPYHSFHTEAKASYFATFKSAEDLQVLLQTPIAKEKGVQILGGGSNILFTKDVDALVLKNELEGIYKTEEFEDHYLLEVGAGMNWHQLVMYCIHQDMAGVENLALIPGSVGASPIQNIGAYGVELKDVFHSLDAVHVSGGRREVFSKEQCQFGYRESIFKNQYKNRLVILSVTFRLWKKPRLNLSYGAIQQELKLMGIKDPGIKDVAQAVMNIRNSKLPNPEQIGNAGSFFKNPEVSEERYTQIKKGFPEIPGHPSSSSTIKIPAGWLIEQCGWKGHRKGDAGCYDKQALVLVNYGNASGKEIYDLSEKILQSVYDKFGISLVREVNIW